MRSNVVIAGGLILLVAIMFATLRPARSPSDNVWLTKEGVVTEMYETAFKDLVLKLQGDEKTFYIDGAFDQGIDLAQLKDKLMYKPVVIQYPDQLNPLQTDETRHYISRLEMDGEIIYKELK